MGTNPTSLKTASQKTGFYCYEVVGMCVYNVTPTVKIAGPPEMLERIAKALEELGEDPTPEGINAALKVLKE